MEYISREEAIDKMRSLKSGFRAKNDWDSGYDTAIAEAFEHIKRVPVADVQPVKRGRWIRCGKLEGKIVMKCSVCEQGITAMFAPKYHYCPNCGARMDGEPQ